MKLYHANSQRIYEVPHPTVNLGYVKMLHYQTLNSQEECIVLAQTEEEANVKYIEWLAGRVTQKETNWYGITIIALF